MDNLVKDNDNRSRVTLLRMNSGEEIICSVTINKKTGIYFIEKPLILIPHQESIAVMQWVPYTKAQENGIHIHEKFIAFEVDPSNQLLEEYIKATTTTPQLYVPGNQPLEGPMGEVPQLRISK